MIDHQKFRNSCVAKNNSAVRLLVLFCFHTSHRAIPINRYSTVHTGPNTAGGGNHDGLARFSNQEVWKDPASKALKIPVASQMAMQARSISLGFGDKELLIVVVSCVFIEQGLKKSRRDVMSVEFGEFTGSWITIKND